MSSRRGPQPGEPNTEPVVVDLGRHRRDDPYPMPYIAATRARVMAGLPTTREGVQKFAAGVPGTSHGDQPGDVPVEGTPISPAAPLGGSSLPLVAASRQLQRTEDQWTDLVNHGQVLPPPYDPWYLVCSYEESDALGYLVDAMATNLTGFGFELVPLFPTRDEETGEPVDPPAEALAEREQLELFMASANLTLGLIGLLQCVDQDVEITGNGYLEVLRDVDGNVAAFEHAKAWSMRLGKLSRPIAVEVPFRHPSTGELITLRRFQRFRTFVQIQDGRVSYFKEFGDPRFINWKTGEYGLESWGVDPQGNSLDGTEIVHRLIYSPHSAYGVPRWVGAAPHVRSGRCAGELIVSWFTGAPIGAKLAMIAGGSWNSDSMTRALGKIDDLARGKDNAWTLIGLEGEVEGGDLIEDTKATAPRISLEDLAYDLPDHLFKGEDNLIDGSQRRLARMFRLPPVYWGGTDDFSRAAANSARATTEEQVFVPERQIRWLQWFNTRLLPSMGINLFKLWLKGANTTDDAEQAKGVAGFVQGGGASPNMLIRLWNEHTGQEAPPIPEPWGDRPLALTQALVTAGMDPNMPLADTVGQAGEVDPDADPAAATASAGAVDPDAPAQDTALNGAQVTAALAIVQEVVAGGLTEDMAKAMLIEFFNLSDQAATAILVDASTLQADDDEDFDEDLEGDPMEDLDEDLEGEPPGGSPRQQQVAKRRGTRMGGLRTVAALERMAATLERDLEATNPDWFS